MLPILTHPTVTVGAVAAGDSFEIGMGEDENGFGRIWNKTTVDMAELNGELYLAVGHNYEDGTRIWKTDNRHLGSQLRLFVRPFAWL